MAVALGTPTLALVLRGLTFATIPDGVTTGADVPVPDSDELKLMLPACRVSSDVAGPANDGAKRTVIWQLWFACSVGPQVLVCKNGAATLISSGTPLVDVGFENVNTCGTLCVAICTKPKLNALGSRLAVPTGGLAPAPVRLALTVPLLVVTTIEPFIGPGAVGVKVTMIWQFAPGPSDEGQLLVCE
jgi:hypothetical protein